jgi:hypothetical protein
MIQSGRASLTVLSTETDPALVSEILDLVPSSVKLRGSVSGSGRQLDHNVWTMDVERRFNAEADETGTRALSDLVTAARSGIGTVPALAQRLLRQDLVVGRLGFDTRRFRDSR